MPETQNILWVDNGRRKLAYKEYGDPEGFPVFHFHGIPSSRLELSLVEEKLKGLGARIIALERPGIGDSDFQKGRTILDWPKDVQEAADFFKFEKFSIFGLSGGVPYALACAYKLPHRLESVILVSGTGPQYKKAVYETLSKPDRLLFHLSRNALWLTRIIFKILFKNTDKFLSKAAETLAQCDKKILNKEKVFTLAVNNVNEAVKNGTKGLAWETRLHSLPWGFDEKDVNFPVKFFHGKLDTIVPAAISIYYANTMPGATSTLYPGEGHFSLFINRISNLINALKKPD